MIGLSAMTGNSGIVDDNIPIPPSSLLEDILAWWMFNETAGSRLDATGNGYDLTDNGSVGSGTGLIKGAATITAASGQFLSSSSVMIPDGPFSVSLWFKPSIWTNGTCIWMQGSGSAILQGLQCSTTALLFRTGSGASFLTATKPSLNAWHHLVGTYDGDGLGKLFIDGRLKISNALLIFTDGALAAAVGANAAGTVPAKGSYDLMGLWTRALTDGEVEDGEVAGGEVAALYNAGAGLNYPFIGA